MLQSKTGQTVRNVNQRLSTTGAKEARATNENMFIDDADADLDSDSNDSIKSKDSVKEDSNLFS